MRSDLEEPSAASLGRCRLIAFAVIHVTLFKKNPYGLGRFRALISGASDYCDENVLVDPVFGELEMPVAECDVSTTGMIAPR